jgi:hypothetical protein
MHGAGEKFQPTADGSTLLKGGSKTQWRGARESWATRGGLEEGGPTSHRRGQLRRRSTAGSGPAAACAGGMRARTVECGAGSLTSGAQMAAGGHWHVWVGRGRKWSGPSPYEQC